MIRRLVIAVKLFHAKPDCGVLLAEITTPATRRPNHYRSGNIFND